MSNPDNAARVHVEGVSKDCSESLDGTNDNFTLSDARRMAGLGPELLPAGIHPSVGKPDPIRDDSGDHPASMVRDNPVRERRGDWLQTFSGRQFWPMDPRASEVFIEDIAHALAMQCRFAGHCLRFYSVAEHSVLLTRYFRRVGASTTIQLWALLHDASEAYLVDVPRPVKPYLEGYRQAEASVMAAICEKFDLPKQMPAEVHEADGRILNDERINMAPCVEQWGYNGPPLGVYLRNWTPEVAEGEFLAEFRRLMDERHEERRTA